MSTIALLTSALHSPLSPPPLNSLATRALRSTAHRHLPKHLSNSSAPQTRTMKALRYSKTGSLDNLQLEDVSTPDAALLGPGQALIRIGSSGVHRSDVVGIQGWLPFVTVPRIPGRDYMGTVIAVADQETEVTKQKWIGKRVWSTGGNVGFTEDGGWAQFKVTPLSALAPVPDSISDLYAGSAGLAWVCADLAVGSKLSAVNASDEVIIIGASGDIGSAATQLALAAGASKVYATFTSASRLADSPIAQHAEQGKYGAGAGGSARRFVPIDLSALKEQGQSLSAHIRALGARPSVLIDAYGSEDYINDLIAVLLPRARVVVMANHSPDGMGRLNIRKFYAKGLIMYGLSSGLHTPQTGAALLESIANRFQSGELLPPSPEQLAQLVEVDGTDRDAVQRALLDVEQWSKQRPVIVFK